MADAKQHPFVALNGALSAGGAQVRVEGDAAPAELCFAEAGDGVASHPRVLIHAASGSRGVVVVDHRSVANPEHFSNAVIEAQVEANAQLDVVVLQRVSDRSFHVGHLAGGVERDGRLRTTS